MNTEEKLNRACGRAARCALAAALLAGIGALGQAVWWPEGAADAAWVAVPAAPVDEHGAPAPDHTVLAASGVADEPDMTLASVDRYAP